MALQIVPNKVQHVYDIIDAFNFDSKRNTESVVSISKVLFIPWGSNTLQSKISPPSFSQSLLYPLPGPVPSK